MYLLLPFFAQPPLGFETHWVFKNVWVVVNHHVAHPYHVTGWNSVINTGNIETALGHHTSKPSRNTVGVSKCLSDKSCLRFVLASKLRS